MRYNLSVVTLQKWRRMHGNQCMRTSKREYSLRHKLQPLNSSKQSSLFIVTPQKHCWAARSTVVDRGPQRHAFKKVTYD